MKTVKYEKDLISVILPVYNVEKYLERCLQSIISNSYQKLEIICINDGSTDLSINILNEFKKLDDRIIVINKENGGLSSARNAGLEMARGEFISFIDSDDWIHRCYFEYLHKAIRAGEADIANCDFNRTKCKTHNDKQLKWSAREITIKQMLSMHGTKSYVWNKLYRHECIAESSFDESVKIEDEMYIFSIFANGNKLKVMHVDVPLYYYYYRENSLISFLSTEDYMVLGVLIYQMIERLDSRELKAIFAKEVLKRMLATRYVYILCENISEIKKCNHYLKKTLKYMGIERGKYFVFYKFPFIYRFFRIMTDRSLIEYEKNIRLMKDGGGK